MSPCEGHQADISAFVDGELSRSESATTVDHLVACDPCRRFYTDCRRLDDALQALRSRPPRARGIRLRLPRARGPHITAAVVAAAVLVAVGIGFLRHPPSTVVPPPPGDIVVRWAHDRGSMTDARFLALTKELLEADPRYQWEMLDVLQQVRREAYAEEGDASLVAFQSDHDPEPAESRAIQRDGGDVPRIRRDRVY